MHALQPGAEPASDELDRAVRRTFRLAPTAQLDELLMVEKMPVTRNVFLTRGGAVFVYSPYEIAAYAQGKIWVFVPLSELRPLLRLGPPGPVGAR